MNNLEIDKNLFWYLLNIYIFSCLKEYVYIFWVGLMDGDGSIVVNLDKSKPGKSFLRFRFFIALLNIEENLNMLLMIKYFLGGSVIIGRQNKYVTWSVQSIGKVLQLIKILDKYPLLTTRKICQLIFFKNCLTKNDVNYFLKNKNNKYDLQISLLVKYRQDFEIPDYFNPWLSGFIEAEGCFTKRKNSRGKKYTLCFNIGQNYDDFLILVIKNYFQSTNKLQLRKNMVYFCIDMYGPQIKLNIIEHIKMYPLLGAKMISYKFWISLF